MEDTTGKCRCSTCRKVAKECREDPVVSLLGEIRSQLALLVATVGSDRTGEGTCTVPLAGKADGFPKSVIVDFPDLTAREIVEKCGNKVTGGRLLWNKDWYEKEAFFATDRCRKGRRLVDLDLAHRGKSWDECKSLAGSLEMLNFAEVVYLLANHEEFREVLGGDNWTWTSSLESAGKLVSVGDFTSGGAYVGRKESGYASSYLGVTLSRSATVR